MGDPDRKMTAEVARVLGLADGEAGRPSRYLEFAPDGGRSRYIRGYADAIRARQLAGER